MNEENEKQSGPKGTEELKRELADEVMSPIGDKARVVMVLDVGTDKDGGITIDSTSSTLATNAAPFNAIAAKSLRRALGITLKGFKGPSEDELAGCLILGAGDSVKALTKFLADSIKEATSSEATEGVAE